MAELYAPHSLATVFIDTSIDTHLVLNITHSDTVSNLKDSLILEHGRCFPDIGEIKVHVLKVKRKGNYYQLPNSVLVTSAFESTKKTWYLHADVSMALLTTNQLVHEQGFEDENHPNDDKDLIVSDSYSSDKPVQLKRKSNSLQETSPAKESNECMKQKAESEKRCGSSGKDNLEKATSICSPGINNTLNNDMPKMDHMDMTIERNLQSLHDPEMSRAGGLNPSQDGLQKPGKSTLLSALSDTEAVNSHGKRIKKRTKNSNSKFLNILVNQVTNLIADSHIVLPGTNGQESPESAKSEKGTLFSGKHDLTAMGHLDSMGIHHYLYDDMLKVDNTNKTEERKLSTVNVPERRQTEELDPSALLVTKEIKAHESSRKKRSKISRSGVQDEHMDRARGLSLLLPGSDHQCCEDTVTKGNCSSKVDSRVVEQNQLTLTVDIEATDGVKRGCKRKKRKVKNSGAAAKEQQNRENIVAENDLNMEQVPETKLSSNFECPDVLKAFEINEATEDGKAIGETKTKQKEEKAVARVQETVDMNRDAGQINNIVSASVNSPDPDDLVPPSDNDEIYQKTKERDLLVNSNVEEMVVSVDISSYRDQNEPVIETVSNTKMSTATVTEEQKMSGTRMKTRARKTVLGDCEDGVDTENTKSRKRPSSSELNRHAVLQVKNDKDLLPVFKGLEESSDISRGKNTPQIESHLNQVPAELNSPKGGVSECTGKEIYVEQYFVPCDNQDEVTREASAGTVVKQKREEVGASASMLQPYFSKSSKARKRVSTTKKKIGKRLFTDVTTSSDFGDMSTPPKPVSPDKKESAKSLEASGVNSSSKTYQKLPLKSSPRDRKKSSFRTGKNTSSKQDGKVVNKSKQEKSLGHIPKPIFRDSSSGSSLHENSAGASTHTPSNNLSSSTDLSGVDENDKGGSKKSVSSSEIYIPMDTILRRSSMFKKAKLAADQQFEDPDCEPAALLPLINNNEIIDV